jgi:signal transduction histidine kinase/CheY-like chemotaxis protein
MPHVQGSAKAGIADPALSTGGAYGLTDEQLARELEYLDLHQSMAASHGVIVPYSVLGLGMLAMLMLYAPSAYDLLWAGVFACYIAARWCINERYARTSETQRKDRLREWHRLMVASSFFFGILVSAPLWIAFPISPVEIKLLCTMVIALIVSAAPRLITMRQFLALILATATLTCGAWLVWGGDLGKPMAAAGGFLSCLLIEIARQSHFGLRREFELHLRNEHQARELARQNAVLEQTNQARTLLLAAASHDLRQPVHALGLLMEVIRHTPDHWAARRRLAMASECVESLSEMLNQLLDFARMDSGHFPVRQCAIPLQGILDEAMRMLGATARSKGLVMRIMQTPLWFHTDPHLLRRMVFNLVSNAIKYTEDGSVHVYIERAQQGVILHVEDSGVGIAANRLEHIFADYVTSDEPAAGVDARLGLGLGIVRRCAHLLDLRITVYSQPGQGSCFSVHLGSPVEPDIDAPSDAPGMNKLSGVVAVVENDPAILEGLSQMLSEWGFVPVAGSTPAHVQAQLTQLNLQPHLILSDLHLGMAATGFDAIASLRLSTGLAHVPAVVLTGDISPDHLKRAEAHDVRLEHKPMRPARLRELLEGMLETV